MPEPTSPVATNTLIITNLEAKHFEQEIMLLLKEKVEAFGQVYYFAPIKSFYRVFVVYNSTADAQQAKSDLHNTDFDDITIRVYFGQHTEISEDPSARYLHPPELEKNWLISPPGSPPVGWTQVREDPPNSVHLADDLVKALLDLGQPIYQLPQPDGTFADRSHLFEAEVEHLSLDEPNHQDNLFDSKGTEPKESNINQSKQGKLPHQDSGLKINTQSFRTSSPLSVSSPGSSLFPPSTPTVLAFSPAKESEGDQPFITVQDWGVEEPIYRPLKRSGTIPKTAFPTGPLTQK